MKDSLPSYKEVFFVHYQCDKFDEGNGIKEMGIYAKGKCKEYKGTDEAAVIEQYCQRVKELCAEGLIPVHWNQNRPYFGADHICERYKEITGNDIAIEYENDIELSGLLIEIYGDDYVPHPRLDNLAELNQCFGSTLDSKRVRTLSADRLILVSKMYHKLLNNKLIIGKPEATMQLPIEIVPTKLPSKTIDNKLKLFPDYLLHSQKDNLAAALRTEFSAEKGKSIRIMLGAMEQYEPALITIGKREGQKIYDALKLYFDRDIGSRQSIFDNTITNKNDKEDVEKMKLRIKHILKDLK
jgi:hypothetical protein